MKNKQVEAEMLKMLFVVREMRGVLENMGRGRNVAEGAWNVSENIMEAFVEEVAVILAILRRMEGGKEQQYIKRTISECNHKPLLPTEQQQKTSTTPEPSSQPSKKSLLSQYQIRLRDKQGKPGPKLQIPQLVTLNHELSDQNEYLQQKVKEAEAYIKKLEQERQMLLSEKEEGERERRGSRYGDAMVERLRKEVEGLREELRESSEFIVKNNQEFVAEIQRYNETIWKLQHQIETLRMKLQQAENTLTQQKMRESSRSSNFRLRSLQKSPAHHFKSPSLLDTQTRFISSTRHYSVLHNKQPSIRTATPLQRS